MLFGSWSWLSEGLALDVVVENGIEPIKFIFYGLDEATLPDPDPNAILRPTVLSADRWACLILSPIDQLLNGQLQLGHANL